jgi:glycosyltransferase involved in cell wall biosynthesis
MNACCLIPAYNEGQRIAAVAHEALRHAPAVVVVDDGSTDATAREARAAGAVVLRHDVNQGKGAALETGFQYARDGGFEVVITLDADGQHAPSDIPRFLEGYARTGAPVIVGSRMSDLERMPLIRKLTNWYMSWLLSRIMKQWVPDTQCGYRLYRTDALPRIALGSRRFAAESEILLHLADRGLRIESVPIQTIYGGEKSKIHPVRDTVRFFRMLSRYRRGRKPRAEGGSP